MRFAPPLSILGGELSFPLQDGVQQHAGILLKGSGQPNEHFDGGVSEPMLQQVDVVRGHSHADADPLLGQARAPAEFLQRGAHGFEMVGRSAHYASIANLRAEYPYHIG